jgi:hypothetical protein
MTYIFVYNNVNNEIPYLAKYEKRKRTSFLMYIAFFYSFIIGMLATVLIGTESLKYADKICEYKSYYISIPFLGSEAYISPGFLLVFSFVAMFIGLFINLIFEDKRITDS